MTRSISTTTSLTTPELPSASLEQTKSLGVGSKAQKNLSRASSATHAAWELSLRAANASELKAKAQSQDRQMPSDPTETFGPPDLSYASLTSLQSPQSLPDNATSPAPGETVQEVRTISVASDQADTSANRVQDEPFADNLRTTATPGEVLNPAMSAPDMQAQPIAVAEVAASDLAVAEVATPKTETSGAKDVTQMPTVATSIVPTFSTNPEFDTQTIEDLNKVEVEQVSSVTMQHVPTSAQPILDLQPVSTSSSVQALNQVELVNQLMKIVELTPEKTDTHVFDVQANVDGLSSVKITTANQGLDIQVQLTNQATNLETSTLETSLKAQLNQGGVPVEKLSILLANPSGNPSSGQASGQASGLPAGQAGTRQGPPSTSPGISASDATQSSTE